MALSLFDLPEAINPHEESTSSFGSDSRSAASGRESQDFTSADEARERETSGATRTGTPVGGRGDTPAGRSARSSEHGAPSTEGRGLGGMLELNSATRAELEELPGIGPALADRIVQHRTRVGRFSRVDDLLDVSGIGEKTLSRFRAYVYVSQTGR